MKLDENVCRVCLRSKGTVALFDGFFNEQFRYCTMLEAKADDGFPSKLCKVCTNHMRIAYDFRFQAIYAEQYFQKTISLAMANPSEAALPQVVLEENMQEIAQLIVQNSSLLATETIVREDNSLCLSSDQRQCVVQEDKNGYKGTFAEPATDSDEPNDSFEDIFDSFDKLNMVELDSHAATEKKKCIHKGTKNALTASAATTIDSEPLNVIVKPNKSYRNIKKEKPHKVECNVCGTTFTHINSLKQHLLKHSGERPFRCEFCEKTFTRRTILNIHRRLHTGERPYGCDECIQTFVTKEAMNRHKERDHKETIMVSTNVHSTPTYTCVVCKKTRFTNQDLLTHMRTHQKHNKRDSTTKGRVKRRRGVEKPRRHLQMLDVQGRPLPTVKYCKTCQQGFASKWELAAHQEVHKDAHQFVCKVCQCTFEKQYKLLRHLETHNNREALTRECMLAKSGRCIDGVSAVGEDDEDDKPLAVRIKERNRRTKRNPRSDWKRHTSSEPETHNCDHCGTTFRRQTLLNIHRRRHQCHKCPQCGAAGMSKEVLKEHMAAMHVGAKSAVNGFNCVSCRSSFNDIDGYTDHWAIQHAAPVAFVCSICPRKFDKKYKLLYHLEMHKIRRYVCKKCGEILAVKEQLLRHIKGTHFDKCNHDYQCPECAAGLYDMRDLKLHLNECHDARIEDLNACDLCSSNHGTVLEYYAHVYSQHDNISKTCNECDLYFESRKLFDKHVFGHYMDL